MVVQREQSEIAEPRTTRAKRNFIQCDITWPIATCKLFDIANLSASYAIFRT